MKNRKARFEVTPALMRALLEFDLTAKGSPILLTPLGARDALSTRVVRNARIMLAAIAEEPQRLTEKLGLLNRKFVTRMFDELELPEGLRRDRSYSRVLDEDGVRPMMWLRLALEFAEFTEVRSGRVHATERGRELLAEERAGEMHLELYLSVAREVNMAAFDSYPQDDEMLGHMPFVLFRLGTLLRKPLALTAFAERLPHDDDLWVVSQPVNFEGVDPVRELATAFTIRVLEPLAEFGLLTSDDPMDGSTWPGRDATREEYVAWFNRDANRRWELTPLFDRFIAIRVDGTRVSLSAVDAPVPVEQPFPPTHVMGLSEAIDAFILTAGGGADTGTADALGDMLAILELAAQFAHCLDGDHTPVEHAVTLMPQAVGVVVRRKKSRDREIKTSLLAATFSAFALWAEDEGQARYRHTRKAVMQLEQWVAVDDVPDLPWGTC